MESLRERRQIKTRMNIVITFATNEKHFAL